MKYIIIILSLSGMLVSSCTSNKEVEKLNLKIEQLETENLELLERLEEYHNSIVIKSDQISTYLIPATFGPSQIDKNEEVTFVTHLVIKELPDNVEYEWTSTPKAMNLKGDGIPHYLTNVYGTSGKRKFDGFYQLRFPNGHTEKLEWSAEFEVK